MMYFYSSTLLVLSVCMSGYAGTLKIPFGVMTIPCIMRGCPLEGRTIHSSTLLEIMLSYGTTA